MSCKADELLDKEPVRAAVSQVPISPNIAVKSSNQAGRGWLVAAEILYRVMSRTSAFQRQGDDQNDAYLNKRS
jgi:hypothetical protein